MSARHLTRATFGIVLAGGRGSRLMQLTDWRAKPAVPFGGKFRIIDFTLSNCVNSGVRRIGVATQYKAQSLIQHLQRGWSFLDGRFHEFIDILPAQQQVSEDWYRGTADAAYQNLGLIRRNRPKYVLVLSGDHVYKMDYGRILLDHVQTQADLTVACMDVPLTEASAFGIMDIGHDKRVSAFIEKPVHPSPLPHRPDRALANMGVYVFNADFLYEQLIRDKDDPDSAHDFGRNVIPHCVRHHRVFAHSFADSCVGMDSCGISYWRDVGTIDAYWEANMELTKVTPELNLYDEVWPIWTHQEQLPPAKFVFDDDGRRGMAVDSLVSGGTIISGATVHRSLLFSRVRVHSYAQIEDSVILPDVDIGRHAKLRRVVLDKHCHIPENMTIGYDAETDRRRFHVSEHGITLVTPEMLGQQAHHIIR
ncbi:glucose-1-phosphate adenylyltransferase [Rugosibacter aromaticivorans]|uniref:Glucose-1-phosphate adenylyltransferase n=1 Tax=Rugosibacter aromaticivorans TaxID=1565605 RepID=A0A0C5J8U9_9PROT|nr:glucose-1-phosphate adenylyltransferase [Rugosibacter aromaticivorans]AJP48128.1 glucose-1-phosphate adenylyltransferase [Rugosibacter aromaticivorans]TBR15470.1 MAG: glucose-1-phosphate adenylyltransferase [Rugosibacter sp.]